MSDFAPGEAWVKAPEMEFRADICLNGLWQFQPIALPKNFVEGVDAAPSLPLPAAEGWATVPLKVPSPWNVNSFADEKGMGGDFRSYPSYPKEWEELKMGWMKRAVKVPADWKGRRIVLRFEAVAGDAVVLVNGKEIGHKFDLFFPFQLDATDVVKFGETNEILVGVRKASLFDKRGNFGRRTYQAGSFWGQHIVGIWNDVNLVALPAIYVKDVFVQPLVDRQTLKVEVTLRNDGLTEQKVEIAGSAYPWISLAGKSETEAPVPLWKLGDKAALTLPSLPAVIPPGGETTITLEQKGVDALALWSPESPALYGLLVDVKNASGQVDRKYSRFGWRQISIKGSQLTLNGKPIILKGESWHFMGIPQMSRRYAWAWFQAVRDANGNAVRLHAEPYPDFYLDVADEVGMLILDETAIWASDGGPKLDDDAYWKDTAEHVTQLVMRDRSHPSVFGWSVCNEVKPVVQNVFHGPASMMETLVKNYQVWAEICHRLDPTRDWISADGDDDGQAMLPSYVIHYGDEGTMKRAAASGKPWGVGEASGAYYMTPDQSAKYNGERSYESFEGRMEAIALESYEHLLMQKKHDSSYRSVFNLVWYALQPLPLGLKDATRAPELQDGVFFQNYIEGKPGVQPERLGPYCTSLNPGYDPALPKYITWPLFDAIKNANAEPPLPLPWKRPEVVKTSEIKRAAAWVQSAALASGEGGRLGAALAILGVSLEELKKDGVPQILFIDGAKPPGVENASLISKVLEGGGMVMVWGVDRASLSQLNALLPAAIELTDRKSSSLLAATDDPLVAGLTPSQMYFSELRPAEIISEGIGGPILQKADVLLRACDTDWLRWNKRSEFAKTAMIVRSEKESKPSGAALIRVKQGKGQWLICNLAAEPKLFKAQSLNRALLQNLGLPLKDPVDVGQPLLKTGKLTRALAAGRFSIAENIVVAPDNGGSIRTGASVANKTWKTFDADGGVFDFFKGPLDGPRDQTATYLSFWVMSPRALDNLLIEPNIPRVDLSLKSTDALEFTLNGKSLGAKIMDEPEIVIKGLPIQQGWNHFLIRVVHARGDSRLEAGLLCSQPEFLGGLNSSLQKP